MDLVKLDDPVTELFARLRLKYGPARLEQLFIDLLLKKEDPVFDPVGEDLTK